MGGIFKLAALTMLDFFIAAVPFSSSVRFRVIVRKHFIGPVSSSCREWYDKFTVNYALVYYVGHLTFSQCLDPFTPFTLCFSSKVNYLFIVTKLWYMIIDVLILITMPELIYPSTWPGTNRIVPSWSYMWVSPLSWSSIQEIFPLMFSVVACMCQYIILSTNKLVTKFRQLRTSLRFLKYLKETPVSRQNRFCTHFFFGIREGWRPLDRLNKFPST